MLKKAALLLFALSKCSPAVAQAGPAPESQLLQCDSTVLFANFEPDAVPNVENGGWRIGGGERDSNAGVTLGLKITPACTGRLTRMEIFASRERGSDPLAAYVTADAGINVSQSAGVTNSGAPIYGEQGPGTILDAFLFSPRSQSPVLVAARSTLSPVLVGGQSYWIVLTAPDLLRDSFFWSRGKGQPSTTVAFRSGTGPWQVYGAYGAMLRIFAEDITLAGPGSSATRTDAAPQRSEPADVLTVGNGVSAPVAIYKPSPSYTDGARRAKVSGTVTLWVIVGPDGRVQRAGVSQSLRPDLDESALETVKTWQFQPGMNDGTPVAVKLNVLITFSLR